MADQSQWRGWDRGITGLTNHRVWQWGRGRSRGNMDVTHLESSCSLCRREKTPLVTDLSGGEKGEESSHFLVPASCGEKLGERGLLTYH